MKKLYLLFVLLIPIGAGAQTIYVDIDNNTGTENGSAEFPYKSLYDGIEAAQIGDTLFIRNGEYNLKAGETYFLLKDGVITIGEDSSQTIINGGFANYEATMMHSTELSNLKCSGVGLANGNGSGTVAIKNCSIEGASFSSGTGYTYIVENCIIDKGVVNSSGNNYWFVKNCVIKNGQIRDFGGAPEGVEAHIIENNDITCSSNDGDNTYFAAISAGSLSITIKNNRIKAVGKRSGIVLSTRTPTNIIGNTIELDTVENLAEDDFSGIYTSAGVGIVTGNKINGGKIGYYSSSGATLFADNEITNAHFSSGGEEVSGNKITNCSGHGMVTYGFRGPVHDNIIMNNDSAGILYLTSVDLGGGNFNGPGRNIIKGNGWYDLVIAQEFKVNDTLFAMYNVWDHDNMEDILQYDILNNGGENLTLDFSENITIPFSPQLKSPENAATEIDTSLNLSWQVVDGAEFYKLQLSETSDFSTVFFEQDSISTLNFTVASLDYNTTYYWRCQAINLAGESDWSSTWSFQTKVATGIADVENAPFGFQIYPNPSSENTNVNISLKETAFVSAEIFNVNGKKIKTLLNEKRIPGIYKIIWNTEGEKQGIYFCKVKTENSVQTKKIVLLK